MEQYGHFLLGAVGTSTGTGKGAMFEAVLKLGPFRRQEFGPGWASIRGGGVGEVRVEASDRTPNIGEVTDHSIAQSIGHFCCF